MSFLTSLPWHLGFPYAEQQCKALLILKTSEPHNHEKASWMEGVSLAEPVPWTWRFGVSLRLSVQLSLLRFADKVTASHSVRVWESPT